MRTSESLVLGEIYSRARLGEMFGLAPIAFQRGVFKPKGHDSVWLFVTERKDPDQPQYDDALAGDVLYWEGETSGRSDAMIVEHRERGLELLLFYRNSADEYPDRGFRYEGAFAYVSHEPAAPTRFVLRRVH